MRGHGVVQGRRTPPTAQLAAPSSAWARAARTSRAPTGDAATRRRTSARIFAVAVGSAARWFRPRAITADLDRASRSPPADARRARSDRAVAGRPPTAAAVAARTAATPGAPRRRRLRGRRYAARRVLRDSARARDRNGHRARDCRRGQSHVQFLDVTSGRQAEVGHDRQPLSARGRTRSGAVASSMAASTARRRSASGRTSSRVSGRER